MNDRIVKLKAKVKSARKMMPLTFMALFAVAIIMLAMSPLGDNSIKMVSAYTTSSPYTITYDANFYVDSLVFNGFTSSIDVTRGQIANFDKDGSQYDFTYDETTVLGGSIDDITATVYLVSTTFLTAKGYTATDANLKAYTNLTCWIESPSAVKTYFILSGPDEDIAGQGISPSAIDYYVGSGITLQWRLAAGDVYSFDETGTYTFGYDLLYYY